MKKKHSSKSLILVLAVVLILCGGNGAGILVAGIIWKKVGRLAPAVIALIGLTALAFVIAMTLVVVNHRMIAEDALANARSDDGDNPEEAQKS